MPQLLIFQSCEVRMRGNSVVSTLASGAGDAGFNPCHGKENLVLKHTSLRVICRDDMNTVPHTET